MDTASNKRDISEFCEQLNEVQHHFSKFDSCERTIALYYLLVGLPFPSARFLQRALEETICRVNTPECQMMERNANDPVFISTFLTENPEIALSRILTHIPLLCPGNKEALKCYCTIIRHILSEIVAPPSYKIYNECVEILSYVFVHPAFSREDKKSFKYTLHNIIQTNTVRQFGQTSLSESSDESYSPNPDACTILQNGIVDLNCLSRHSNSLTPLQMGTKDHTHHIKSRPSKDSLAPPTLKPRSFSLSTDKSLPIGISIQSSSSETRLQDLHNSSTIMKEIVNWLKSLRLHKYSWIFNNLTYDQMLNLTEEDLESIGITKGARHKLLLNISKLKDRSKMLTQMEVEVMNGGDLLSALKKLKTVLQSPLQITAAENLPSQFIKVMGKVCTQLLMLRQPQDECIHMFINLCDSAEALETFTEEQKKRLVLWRGQLIHGNQLSMPIPNFRHQASTSQRQQHVPAQLHPSPTISSFQGYAHKSSSYPNMQGNPPVTVHRHSLGSATLRKQIYQLNNQFTTNQDAQFLKNNLLHTFTTFKNSDLHTNYHEPEVLQIHNNEGIRNSDIESSLESLCLQMMEHALGP